MNILLVTSRYPFPVDGGDKLRLVQIAESLSNNNLVDLVCLSDNKNRDYILEKKYFNNVYFFERNKIYSFIYSLWALIFSNLPIQTYYFYNKKMKYFIENSYQKYDLIFVHLLRMYQNVKNVNKKKFIDATDSIALNYSRIDIFKISNILNIMKIIYKFEQIRLLKFEKNLHNLFDKVFYISEKDVNYLYKSQPENVQVLKNYIDCSEKSFSFHYNSNEIFFIGNNTTEQNKDAIFFFINNIMPLIEKKIIFHIIGKYDQELKDFLEKFDNIKLHGYVAQINKIINRGGIGVCPIRFGAGLQNKNLEYMSLGLPVVTTTIGAEGLNLISNLNCFIADDALGIADKINKLLSSEALQKTVSYQGYEHAKNLFSNKMHIEVD